MYEGNNFLLKCMGNHQTLGKTRIVCNNYATSKSLLITWLVLHDRDNYSSLLLLWQSGIISLWPSPPMQLLWFQAGDNSAITPVGSLEEEIKFAARKCRRRTPKVWYAFCGCYGYIEMKGGFLPKRWVGLRFIEAKFLGWLF